MVKNEIYEYFRKRYPKAINALECRCMPDGLPNLVYGAKAAYGGGVKYTATLQLSKRSSFELNSYSFQAMEHLGEWKQTGKANGRKIDKHLPPALKKWLLTKL